MTHSEISEMLANAAVTTGSAFSRLVAFVYGLAAYALGFVTILYAIGFVTKLGVPKDVDGGTVGPIGESIAINVLLMTVFAVQHSVMARPAFKRWWTRIVPSSVERSTYVLFASLALILLFCQWRPLPEVVWSVGNPQLAIIITGVSLFGWFIVLLSTFLINHFELFGVHQVVNNLRGRPMPPATFKTPALYKMMRHPLYHGFLIALWAAPTMTAGHFLFTAVVTAYIFVGIFLEERDLTELFGDEYRRYRGRVRMLLPIRKG